jgi:HKD family nuclease
MQDNIMNFPYKGIKIKIVQEYLDDNNLDINEIQFIYKLYIKLARIKIANLFFKYIIFEKGQLNLKN